MFAWAASLSSRGTNANALWEPGYDKGSHPNPVLAGNRFYAASRVIDKCKFSDSAGIVRFALVGVKNEAPPTFIARGVNLFENEFDQKVFQIERQISLADVKRKYSLKS